MVSALHMRRILPGEFGRVTVGDLIHGEHSDTYNGVLTIARIPLGQTFSCGLTTQQNLTLDRLFWIWATAGSSTEGLGVILHTPDSQGSNLYHLELS